MPDGKGMPNFSKKIRKEKKEPVQRDQLLAINWQEINYVYVLSIK